MPLLITLLIGVIANTFLSGILTLTALDKPRIDPNRKYLFILATALTANTVAFLTLYAIHYGPSL